MSGSARWVRAMVAFALFFSATAYARAASAPLLSDRDATTLIESWFSGAGWTESVRTGTLVVTRETPACPGDDFERGRISEAEYKTVLAWGALGLVKLSIIAMPARPTGIAQAISTRCEPFALKRIVVTPEAAGLALDEQTPVKGIRDARFLYARTYTAEVSAIVENIEFRQNIDTYRIVKCLVRFHYSGIGRALTRLAFGAAPEHQKQIVLLKYDPFEKRWGLVTSDAAAFNSAFTTQRVADFLVRHGSL